MLIVGNWKAKVERPQDAKRLFAAAKRVAEKKKHDIVIAPPAPFLGLLALGNRTKVHFAAQDVTETLGGAATGEVTATTVAAAGATYAIIGHSERRALGDTDAVVLLKVKHALAAGLTPILCVGEHERDADAQYLNDLRAQLTSVFGALSEKERARIIVAYEPVWAIGKQAKDGITPSDLTEMVLYIRKVLSEFLPARKASALPLLYGGAVESANIRVLAEASRVDGFLVGHASTDVTSFNALVKALG